MSQTTNQVDQFRAPDWRWQRAAEPIDFYSPDRATRVSRRYRRSWEACRSEEDRRILAERMPDLARAHAIFRDVAGPSRAILEARVLADEPADSIAKKCGVSVAVVKLYEAVYYDVRSRLAATDFVVSRLLDADGDDQAAIWKHLAYAGGPVVLDAVLAGRTAAARPKRLEEVTPFLAAMAQAAFSGHLAGTLRRAPSPAALAALGRAISAAFGSRKEDPAATRSELEKHIQAFIEGIPWVTGADAEAPGVLPPAVAAADKGAAEPRDDELLRMSAGERVAGWDEVANLKLPPPRKQRKSLLTDIPLPTT